MKGKTFNSKILLLLTITILSFSFSAVFAQSSNDLLLKAERELYQKIESLGDNEKIDIYIWKTSISQEKYKEELLRLGFDEDIYGNEDLFQSKIVSKLQEYNNDDGIKEIRKEYKISRLQAALADDSSHRTGDSAIFYNQQGAGFLDATNSAKSIADWNKFVRLSTLSSNYYVYIFTPPMDFSIRAVLIFEKPENSQITSNYGNNLNLYLQSPGGTVFSSSTSSTNIFEMLEYTIPANQDILLRVNRAAYISSSLYISISCFWMGV